MRIDIAEIEGARADMYTKVRSAKQVNGFIPTPEYVAILPRVVISTVDFVLTKRVEGILKFLLIIRRGVTIAGEYWILGGKPNPGLPIRDAILKFLAAEAQAKEEHLISITPSHPQDIFLPACYVEKQGQYPPHHMRMSVHVVEVVSDFEPISDGSYSDPGWYTEDTLPTNILPDLKVLLYDAGLIGTSLKPRSIWRSSVDR